MRLWEIASLVMFGYTAAVAALPRYAGRRGRIYLGAAAGMLLTLFAARVGHQPVLHDWVVPPTLLLLAYWTTGRFFLLPRARQEELLMWVDCRLGIPQWARRMPRWTAELLELAYLAVYPMIPLALVLHLVYTPQADAARFWTVILTADFSCFAVLPWVQTRPPRALEADDPWASSIRPFNLQVLGAASVRVNTFPSGHAAEGLTCALLVLSAPWPIAGGMLAGALAIAAGAVLGRYHYAVDALCGWAVAILVWATLGG